MGDVIEFPKDEACIELFACEACGNMSFFIHFKEGYVQCDACEEIVSTLDELLEKVNRG
jgi:hypothetical protein